MKEILPGLYYWTTHHERIRSDVSSYYWEPGGVLIDPRLPDEGLQWFRDHGPPLHIYLASHQHYRHSARFAEAFGCDVRCHASGLHAFNVEQRVQGFEFDQELPGEVMPLEVDAISPDEAALFIPKVHAVAFADGLTRQGSGPLSFLPDALLGDDPERVKQGLRSAYRRIAASYDFDHLLLAHGAPWIAGGREALRRFAAVRAQVP